MPVYIIVGTIYKKESIFIPKRTRDNRDNVVDVPVFRAFPCHGVTTPPYFFRDNWELLRPRIELFRRCGVG